MSLLASLSPEARAELAAFVQEQIALDRRTRERQDARHEWISTDEVGELVAATGNAVRLRLRRGWLSGHVVRDGNRLLVRRSAVLDDLEARAERRRR
jgi:hypothetical protein